MNIRDFISRVLLSAVDADDYRRRLFLLIASGIGAPTLMFLSLLDFHRGSMNLAIISAFGVILMMVNLLFLCKPRSDNWAPRIVLFYICLLMVVNEVHDPTAQSLLWPLMVPIIALFAFSDREGLVWTLLFAIPVGITIVWAKSQNHGAFGDAWIDFSFAYVNLSVIAYGYETLRRLARADSEERANRLQRFVDSSSDWLFELDSELRFTFISPRWEQITGIPIADIIGTSIADQAPTYWNNEADKILKPLYEHRAFRNFRFSFEIANGRRVYVSVRGIPWFDNNGAFMGYSGSGTDVTAYEESRLAIKETEHQLAQSQKMESIGQLTSGIAHDFNNLLTVILGYVDLLRTEDSDNQRMLDALGQAANRASQLTRRLLSFSRQQTATPEAVNTGALLSGMTTLLTRTLGTRIQLHLHVGAGKLTTVANLAQFESAILNLAINARDAMEGAGNLTIETQEARLGGQRMRGDYVLVRVIDDGCGISPEVVDRVKEPFFTTKPEGKGSGLGLAMVNGFVSQCGGMMSIDSVPGRGTTVTLYLPLVEQAEHTDSPVLPHTTVADPRVVLAVEDNEDVAQIIIDMLMSHGHIHHLRQSAEQALAAMEEISPDLVITDVELKGKLSGFELAREVRQRWPHVDIILTTGLPDQFDVNLDETEMLKKPFAHAQLMAAIDRASMRAAVMGPKSAAETGKFHPAE